MTKSVAGRESITTDASEDSYQAWTPDGLQMVFLSTRTGTGDLYSQPLESKVAEPLVKGENRKVPTSFSPDGKVLAFYEVHAQTLRDIWMLPVGGKPQPFIATPADELGAVFSPDGKWIAYVSDESGERQVYAHSPAGPGRLSISTAGRGPGWSRALGTTVYFGLNHGHQARIRVTGKPVQPLAAPGVLGFEGPFLCPGKRQRHYACIETAGD